MSIKVKISILLLVFAIVPLIFFVVLALNRVQDISSEQAADRMGALATLFANRIDETLDGYVNRSAGMTSRTTFRKILAEHNQTGQGDIELLEKILNDAVGSFPDLLNAHVLDIDGSVVAEHKTGDASQEYLPGFLDEEVYYNAELSVITTNLPIRDNDGNNLGVLVTTYLPDNIYSILSDYEELGDTGEVILSFGEVSDGPYMDSGRLGVPHQGGPIIPGEMVKSDILLSTTDYRGESVIAVTHDVGNVDWEIIVKMDRSEIFSGVQELFVTTLIIVAIIIVLLVIFSFIVVQPVTKPISSLTEAIRKMSKKNLNLDESKIATRGGDEVSFLAKEFVTLINELRESYSSLEDKVNTRTQELENARQRLQLATESAGIGVWEWDIKTNELKWDNKMFELYGIKRGDFKGAYDAWSKSVHPEDISDAEKLLKDAVAGKKQFNKIFRIIWPNESVKYIQPYAVAIKDPKGRVEKMIGVNFDVTQAQEVDRAKTEFVSLASHQLRTPLSAIGWYSEMMLSGDAGRITKKQKEYLNEIHEGQKNMAELVSALLDVSRLELGTFTAESQDVDLEKMVRHVLDMVKLKADEKDIKIVVEGNDVPPLKSDERLLLMVVQNLITNAVKYTKSGGQIDISLLCKTKNSIVDKHKIKSDSIIFTVKDNGYGIPASQQDRVFTKLFRADNIVTLDTEGTGLGLYTVKKALDVLGGEVWFDSEENKGTTFYCIIPAKSLPNKVVKKSPGKNKESNI